MSHSDIIVNIKPAVLSRASVNILQAGVCTSMVLNLDVRYALAIKSDVTLQTEAKTILAVCMHYARQARREQKWGLGNHYRGALSQPHSVCAQIETPIRRRKRGEGCPLNI